MKVLLTGGTGYIGSHIAVSMSKAGHEVYLYDNFSNSGPTVLFGLKEILGQSPIFIEGDIRDTNLLNKTLSRYAIEAVIHCAGLKAVGESVENPLLYYENNVFGTISLLNAMSSCGIKRLIFSSSATVYGDPSYLPLDEEHPISPVSPYGNTKAQIEDILRDLSNSDSEWRIVCLRYFNPVGAHESGLIGENPNGVPNNLMPYMAQVAVGALPYLSIYGDDYMTDDGTGVRDFIHVVDLAEGHMAALAYLDQFNGWDAINLGTGNGHSVFDLLKAYEIAASNRIQYKIASRREGDIAICYAKVDKALEKLRWKARLSIDDMCKSSWNWAFQSHQKTIL
jgi:UDP-glucose 4-epimerase